MDENILLAYGTEILIVSFELTIQKRIYKKSTQPFLYMLVFKSKG